MSTLYLGVMSGTSLDGVDAVLVDFANGVHVLGHSHRPYPDPLRATFSSLNQSGEHELHRAALAGNALAKLYAQTCQDLLTRLGVGAAQISALGAHGQTVRHQPAQHDGVGYSWQINNPSLLAELTHIRVVADFRSRDIAAGGQGAPLVPAFHQSVFANAHHPVAVLNLGGMSNLSLLRAGSATGFDCGPGNVLLDLWCQQHTGEAFDRDGLWAAQGKVNPALLQAMLSEAFFQQPPPKSTGRDLFHAGWLNGHLPSFGSMRPQDVQATLTALTAKVCADALHGHAPDVTTLWVCGGGAYNLTLMQALKTQLPRVDVATTDAAGLPPLQVEAAAFAWLAKQTCEGLPGNLPQATGALGPRVLGAIYPA
jgi:anhydro-N-acetylmuramic acid kinase